MPTIREIIKTKLKYLKDSGVNASSFEVKLLLSDVLNRSVADLIFYDLELTKEQEKLFETYIEKRKNFYPVDKILGKKSFYKSDFEVSEDVLSPRYDTEILIEESLKIFNPADEVNILEFGTGSGCIVISLLNELKKAKATGVDISAKALEMTRKNATNHNVLSRLNLLNLSWFDSDIESKIPQKFDLIISNPPYIPTKDIDNLDVEVKNFDPLIALDGGEDGLRDYEKICEKAEKMLNTGGYLIFEVGINQAQNVTEKAQKYNFEAINIVKDYTGIDRCVILKKLN